VWRGSGEADVGQHCRGVGAQAGGGRGDPLGHLGKRGRGVRFDGRTRLGVPCLPTRSLLGSGLAFWAVSGIWTRHDPGGPNYAYNFACWTLAFLPGFLALLLRDRPGPAIDTPTAR